MADILETYLRLYGTGTFQQGLSQVAGAYGQAGRAQERFEAGQQRISAGGLLVGGAMTAMGLGIAAGLKGAVEAADRFESRIKSFNIVFKQGEGFSRSYMRQIQDFSLQTTFGSDTLAAYAQRMKAVGFETKELIPTLRTMLDAVAGAGGGQQRLDRVLLAITHIQEQGRLVQRSLNMLELSGVISADQLGKRLGLTKLQMAEVGRQHVTAAKALPVILQLMRDTWGGGMAAQLDTIRGKQAQIKEVWDQIKISIGEDIQPGILKGLSLVYGSLKGIRDLVRGSQGAGWGLAGLSAALTLGGMWQLGRTGALALRGLEGAAGVGPGLMSVMAARMFGFGAAGAAIGGMGAAAAGGRGGGFLLSGEAAAAMAAGGPAFGAGIARAGMGGAGMMAMAARIALPVAVAAAGLGLMYAGHAQTDPGRAKGYGILGGATTFGTIGAGAGFLIGGPAGAIIGAAAGAALGGGLGYFTNPAAPGQPNSQEDTLRKLLEAAQKTADNTDKLVDKSEYYRAQVVGGEDMRRPFPEAKLNAILHAMS